MQAQYVHTLMDESLSEDGSGSHNMQCLDYTDSVTVPHDLEWTVNQQESANSVNKSTNKERFTQEYVSDLIKKMVEELTGRDVEGDEPLMAAGINSRRAMELYDSLEESLGIEMPGTVLFSYPSVNAVVRFS